MEAPAIRLLCQTRVTKQSGAGEGSGPKGIDRGHCKETLDTLQRGVWRSEREVVGGQTCALACAARSLSK